MTEERGRKKIAEFCLFYDHKDWSPNSKPARHRLQTMIQYICLSDIFSRVCRKFSLIIIIYKYMQPNDENQTKDNIKYK